MAFRVVSRAMNVPVGRATERVVRNSALLLLILAGCATSSGGLSEVAQPVSCSGALTRALADLRTGSGSDTSSSAIDWLGDHCSGEYDTYSDYVSSRAAAQQFGVEACDEWTSRIGLDAVDLLRSDGLCVEGIASASGEDEGGATSGGLAWRDALANVGTSRYVCGPLVNTGKSNDDVFLNIGRGYPDPERFTIVIWDVGAAVDELSPGAELCVSGVITEYEGVAQIEVRDPGDVKILG